MGEQQEMKRLNSFITEVKGEKAHREAIAMGLKYKGFGYWVDPNTNQVTHKTENDQLVPVDPDVESELADKEDETAGMAGRAGGGPGGGMSIGGAASAAALGMPDQEAVLGTADPEQGAKAPVEMDWTAGPDGDNCVNDQEPGDVPIDSYVGKTNYPNWQAGPDGSNFTNVREDTFTDQMNRNLDADDKIKDIEAGKKRSAPNSITRGKMERKKVQDVKDKEDAKVAEKKQKHARAVANRVRLGSLNRKMGQPEDGPETKRDAAWLQKQKTGKRTPMLKGALDAVGVGDADPKDKLHKSVIERLKKIKTGDPAEVRKEVGKEIQGQKDRDKAKVDKQIDKDKARVAEMNKEAKRLFTDPEYDLDDIGEEIGAGAFGSVNLGSDGESVIKQGQIGPEEMIAMMKMRDHPGFPTLLNGEFYGNFEPFSSVGNNPMGKTANERDDTWRGKGAYWDPDVESGFEDRFPGAEGRYAMTLAKGQTLDDYFANNGTDDAEEVFEKVLRLRRDMHKNGIAHNDMHGHNIFVDDDGTPSVIDLGLAQDDPVAALMEGMGFVSGQDGQFNMGAAPEFMSSVKDYVNSDLMDKLRENRDSIAGSLYDGEIDEDAEDWDDETFEEMMNGGIRLDRNMMDQLKRFVPKLKEDPDFARSLIDRLYDGIGEEPTADRMSKAFDRLRDTQRSMHSWKNSRRLRKGEPYLPLKNTIVDEDD